MPNATRSRHDSPTKTCTKPSCDRPLRARGFCVTHYNEMRGDDWAHPKVETPCDWCGRVTLKPRTKRYAGRYCSDLCKGAGYSTVRVSSVPDGHPSRSCAVPDDHPSRVAISCPVPADHPARRWRRIAAELRECDWCGSAFVTTVFDKRFCTRHCKAKSSRARRKANEGDALTYSWSHVMRVLLLLGGRCAYCDQVIVGPPDPDHVVPVSRGGSNGNANILPSCRPCNSDKRDLLLHEWAADRARLGKPPVRTVLPRSHPAFTHLLPDAITSGLPPLTAHAA